MSDVEDGIHGMVPREKMTAAVRKRRDTYAITPGAPLLHREFWLMPDTIERWKREGMPADMEWEGEAWRKFFSFDEPGNLGIGELGWCEAAFSPCFEDKLIEDRGDTEIVQDFAGRHVLFFKNRRCGFMPEYVDHPVKDMKTWEENVKWRLNPASPERFANLDQRMDTSRKAAAKGVMMTQGLIGGYMYLRSLIGPVDLLYMFVDQPELIHSCMKTWLELSDTVIAKHQQQVTLDEIFFAEDICYNHGSLISPDMIKEFLLPYYQQLVSNVKSRQIDKTRKLYVQVDTDGFCDPVIPLYREAIGMDMISPFEVASNCDVLRTGREYPDLIMLGGLDKRELARGKDAIDRMVDRIIPDMRKRGGYIPTVDHGTPEEVSLENYLHFRKRMVELGG